MPYQHPHQTVLSSPPGTVTIDLSWLLNAYDVLRANLVVALVACLAGCGVAFLSFYGVKLARFFHVWVSAPLLRRYRYSSILITIDKPDVFMLNGSVIHTREGPQVSAVDTAGANIQIPITGDLLSTFMLAYQTSPSQVLTRGKEMAVPGSLPMPVSTWPNGLVAVQVDGRHVSMGVRVRVHGSSYLLLASHTLRALSGSKALLRGGSMALPMNPSWPIISYSPSGSLDYCLIEVDKQAWSVLGVKAISPNPTTSGVITTFGVDGAGRLNSSIGQVRRNKARPFGLIHKASTEPGWSGTPLLSSGGIVGWHTGAAAIGEPANEATSVAAVLAAMMTKESAFTAGKFSQVEWDELEGREDVSRALAQTSRGRLSFAVTDSDFAQRYDYDFSGSNFVGRSWADYEDDEELDFGFGDFGRMENASAIGDAEPLLDESLMVIDDGTTDNSDFQGPSLQEVSPCESAPAVVLPPSTLSATTPSLPKTRKRKSKGKKPVVDLKQSAGAKESSTPAANSDQKPSGQRKQNKLSESSMESSGRRSERKVNAKASPSKLPNSKESTHQSALNKLEKQLRQSIQVQRSMEDYLKNGLRDTVNQVVLSSQASPSVVRMWTPTQ